MVLVKEFANRQLAEMAKSVLESQGVHSSIQMADAGGAMPFMEFVSPVALMVSEENYHRALQILDSFDFD